MRVRLTKIILPEQGLVRDAILDVMDRDRGKVAVRSAKGFPIWVYDGEYVEVNDDIPRLA